MSIFVGNGTTTLRVNIKDASGAAKSISGATVTANVYKPSAPTTAVSWAATVVTDKDGNATSAIQLTPGSTDWSEEGVFVIQPKIILSGQTYYGGLVRVRVHALGTEVEGG